MQKAINLFRQTSFAGVPAAVRAAPFGNSTKTRVTREEICALFCDELGYTARDYRHFH